MRNRHIFLIMTVVFFASIFGAISAAAAPMISITSDNLSGYPNSDVPRYRKYEMTFQIGGVGTAFTDYNPFNPNLNSLGSQYYNKKGILVDAVITTPSGGSVTWPCFWYQSSDGSTFWKLRYSPTATGQWTVSIRVKYGSDTVSSPSRAFNCVAGSDHGFIEINSNDKRFFRFSDGTSFYPIGTDISGYSMGGSASGTAFPKMKANGANFTRVLFTSLNIEPYDISKNGSVKSLNNYSMSRALNVDSLFETGEANGIRIIWGLDDWTYIKDNSSQYISTTGREAPATSSAEFFTLSAAKEIYKRKLRYWLARWGYSASLLGLDIINETGGGAASYDWHIEMANYIHTYSAQPHLASGDNGSGTLQAKSVPNDHDAMDFCNYHDYAKYTQGWHINATTYNLETMGCALQYPWMDMSVYADRLARLQWRRYKWMKPLSWNEFGLIYRYPGSSGFPDWNEAYAADPTARHFRDAMWAGMFCGLSVAHWKLDYMLGGAKYTNGGEKMWVFKPLAAYIAGEEFVGLTQETTYSVPDDTNPSPKVTCSNKNIMIVSMHGRDRAYFFAKNLTDVWARLIPNWCYSGGSCPDPPTPSSQSGTVKVIGLDAGTYTLTRWSTTDTNASTQIKETLTITVGADGTATIPMSIGASDVGFAYKLKKQGGGPPPPPPSGSPAISLTQSADKTQAKPGDTVTYTITYKNIGNDAATSVVVEGPVPAQTTFVGGSATNGGIYDSASRTVRWTISSLAAGASGTVQFKVTVD